MADEELIFEREGGVAVITFNRPARMNALSPLVRQKFLETLPALEKDDAVKAVIITGAGEAAFCAGADIEKSLGARVDGTRPVGTRWERTQRIGRYGQTLYSFHKPTIAAVNGVAAGAGMAIALACDIRIASENARFTTSFIKRGLMPDNGLTYNLPRLVGMSRALDLLWTSRMVDAPEAERIGLVNKVVPGDRLMIEAREYASRLARGPSVAIELTKWAVRETFDNDFDNQVECESRGHYITTGTDDFKESVLAMREKREPNFQGK